MDEFAQAAVIAAVSQGPMKWMIDTPAYRAAAQAILIALEVCGKHALATNRAHIPFYWLNTVQAFRAYWQPRDVQQRQGTQAAIGWEEDREQACGAAMDPLREIGQRAPRNHFPYASLAGTHASPD